MTNISEDKIRAFMATEYRVRLDRAVAAMRIGQTSAEVGEHFRRKGISCAGFVTAFNPSSTERSMDENLCDHVDLREALQALGVTPIEGEGVDPVGNWEPEPSWFAGGLEHGQACDLGRRYGQDAIVWIGPDVIPMLVLLR